MKSYQCHKRVEAGKIVEITDRYADNNSGETAMLRFADGSGMKVDADFLVKHNPKVGGYLVRYEDGYLSFSPAHAFELGYAEVVPHELQPSVATSGAMPPIHVTAGEIARLDLQVGDRVVVSVPHKLSAEEMEEARGVLRAFLPPFANCLILDHGATLAIVPGAAGEPPQ